MFRNHALRSALLAMSLLMAACGGPAAQPTAVPPPPTAPATSAPATVAPAATTTARPTVAPTASAAPTEVPPTGFPIVLDEMQQGVVGHLYYTDRERVLTLTTIAGFSWFRQQIHWRDMEGPTPGDYKWGDLDAIVADTHARGVKLLISIVRSPSFYNPTNGLPEDPKMMGNFVEALVKRYGKQIPAYEIWNEQNLAHETGGRITLDDAGKYVELLIECFTRIKAIDPSIIVLAGAPSSTGVTDPAIAVADEEYYRAMYDYRDGVIKDFFDAQAVHPGGAANPTKTLWPDNPSNTQGWNDDETFYFRHVENVRRFMVEEGVGDHQIWITEYGWATRNETPGYEFGNQVSLEQQSAYIIDAMQLAREGYVDENGKPWIGVMFLWNMNFAVLWGAQNQPLHEQASFGILGPDWQPRLSFLAIQSYLATLKD